MHPVHVWIRSESRGTERRAPVVPADIPLLIDAGFQVTVEESTQRIFAVEEYAAAGASLAGEGTWADAPDDAYVLGIKELPDEPESLRHRHIYFAHAFKGQEDAPRTLGRFHRGGGRLLDSSTSPAMTAGGWSRSATGPATWAPPSASCIWPAR